MKYNIDADKLIAEIEKRIKENEVLPHRYIRLDEDKQLLSFITSLQQEQSEVDLKKEVKAYIKDNFTITDEVAQIPEEDRRYSMWEDDMVAFARHFWNKGYNVRKEKQNEAH